MGFFDKIKEKAKAEYVQYKLDSQREKEILKRAKKIEKETYWKELEKKEMKIAKTKAKKRVKEGSFAGAVDFLSPAVEQFSGKKIKRKKKKIVEYGDPFKL